MPIVDKPLAELYNYQGVNPKPADFDEYWDRALAEMHALGTSCDRKPAKFQAPGVLCEDMYFTGAHGARVYAKLITPAGKKDCPAVVIFHGYSGNSGDWADKLPYALNGFVVAALDCRGQGGKSEDVGGVHSTTQGGMIIRGLSDPDPDRMLMRDVFLDTAQLTRIVMALPNVDASRVGAFGGSQGGGLTLACASLEPRIKRLSSSYPFLTDYKRVWDMDLASGAYAEIKTYFRFFDPNHRREEEIFTKLGYVDIQHMTRRIKGETLMLTGLMDVTCPPSTQFAAYNKITAPKRVEIWPDFGHENLPGSGDMTYQWMLGL